MKSHFSPPVVETVAVQLTSPSLESNTSRVCEDGLAPPNSAEKVSEEGETSSAEPPLTSRVTGTTVGLPPDAATDTCPV